MLCWQTNPGSFFPGHWESTGCSATFSTGHETVMKLGKRLTTMSQPLAHISHLWSAALPPSPLLLSCTTDSSVYSSHQRSLPLHRLQQQSLNLNSMDQTLVDQQLYVLATCKLGSATNLGVLRLQLLQQPPSQIFSPRAEIQASAGRYSADTPCVPHTAVSIRDHQSPAKHNVQVVHPHNACSNIRQQWCFFPQILVFSLDSSESW